ncbi:hypothetical protein Brsp06_02330 [Brucella sp. NBRC 13694]
MRKAANSKNTWKQWDKAIFSVPVPSITICFLEREQRLSDACCMKLLFLIVALIALAFLGCYLQMFFAVP